MCCFSRVNSDNESHQYESGYSQLNGECEWGTFLVSRLNA